eukprot:30135-Pelagococcus_subviridis.AAC.16
MDKRKRRPRRRGAMRASSFDGGVSTRGADGAFSYGVTVSSSEALVLSTFTSTRLILEVLEQPFPPPVPSRLVLALVLQRLRRLQPLRDHGREVLHHRPKRQREQRRAIRQRTERDEDAQEHAADARVHQPARVDALDD